MGNVILIILLCYFVFEVVRGYRMGFLKALLLLAAWLLTFALAYAVADYLKKPMMEALTGYSERLAALSEIIAYGVCFVAASIVIRLLFSILIHYISKIGELPVIGGFNHLLGGVMGMAKGLLVVAFVLLVIYLLQFIGFGQAYEALKNDNHFLSSFLENNPFISSFKNIHFF